VEVVGLEEVQCSQADMAEGQEAEETGMEA
jgi:hypothetical protein